MIKLVLHHFNDSEIECVTDQGEGLSKDTEQWSSNCGPLPAFPTDHRTPQRTGPQSLLFDCSYTNTWGARTETTMNAGLCWPRNKTEMSDNETAKWWTFFSEATEKLERLKHGN
ncbi:hypothetical protein Trydic_g16482 [Trypoxylus dichotomus]